MTASHETHVRRLLFVTGTRADYGKLEPLAMSAQAAGFDISFFITGMHMMRRYGETRHEVRRFEGAEFFEFVNQREGDNLEFILSKTILGFSDFVNEHRPDLVVIHGDRIEAMAASIVCAMQYIPSAHIEGGEISGTIDESIRHCNTKLCSTHFVSSRIAKERVVALGEHPGRVYDIGSPELDTHALPSGVSLEEVKDRYQIPYADYGIVIFHPVTSERNTIGAQAKSLFDALVLTQRPYVVIAPNNDPGSSDIFEVLEALSKDRFRVIPSMRFNYFSELMRHCAMMIGNSSAGVREAPFLGIASLDIGTRQNNRGSSTSVVSCSAFDVDKIKESVEMNWGKRFSPSTAFGTGKARDNFAQILKSSAFWRHANQKQFYDSASSEFYR